MRRMLVICFVSFVTTFWSVRAGAFELSVEDERTVQAASMLSGYGFSAIHTVVIALWMGKGKPLDRSWAAGTIMAAISTAGMSLGYITLAGGTDNPDRKAAYELSAPPGLVLGGVQLGLGIEAAQHGAGDAWMDTPQAILSLLHGLSMAGLSTVLIAGANPGSSDLSKVPLIYTWTIAGAALAGYSVLSLAFD